MVSSPFHILKLRCTKRRSLVWFPSAWTRAQSGYRFQSWWHVLHRWSMLMRVPTTRPTVEARNSIQTIAQREAENTRIQLRKHHQASVKKGKFGKHSSETEGVCIFVDSSSRMTAADPRAIVPETGGQVHRGGGQNSRNYEEAQMKHGQIASLKQLHLCPSPLRHN